MSYLTPPIGAKGIFKFKEPVNSKIDSNQELEVKSIRSLSEIENSNEDPLNTIYKIIGLSEEEFKEDAKVDMPIVTFATPGCEYFYVPADMILSIPKITGVRYQEVVIALNIGAMPVEFNFDTLISNLESITYDTIGIKPDISKIPASAVMLVDTLKHKQFMQLLENKKTVDKSYRTKYLELLDLYNKKNQLFNNLLNCAKKINQKCNN